MNPAFSVIFFTTASGAGYGLLIWLALWSALGRLEPGWGVGLWGWVLALVLISAGLMSSTFHLGHPERSWRAITQWRSSWLSREGVLAILTYAPAILFGYGLYAGDLVPGLTVWSGLVAAALALLTVYCTGMIYASLKPIPRWHNAWVPPGYLIFALATGAVLLNAILAVGDLPIDQSAWLAAVGLVAAWLLKLGYWRFIDQSKSTSTSGTATGLSEYGEVRLLESPNTSENYLQKEMGYQIARKHAGKLRRLSLIGCFAAISLAMASLQFDGLAATTWAVLAVALTAIAVLTERWLFFAEAQHAVTLYYGRESV
jgi:DMSO reductase anchor subunit